MEKESVVENNPVIEAVTALMVAMSRQLDGSKLLNDLKSIHDVYLASGDEEGKEIAAIVAHFGVVLHQEYATREKRTTSTH